MRNPRRSIRQTIRTGHTVHATVEELHYGYATVRLNEGARLTNLQVTGGAVSVGDTVIVDYASGTPPVVRPIAVIPPAVELNPLAGMGAELPGIGPRDHGARIFTTGSPITVPHATWTTINFNSQQWDTDHYWSPEATDRLTIQVSGFYILVAEIGWDKTENEGYYGDWTALKNRTYSKFSMQVLSNANGQIGYDRTGQIWTGEGYATQSLTIIANLTQGDYVQVQAKTDNVLTVSRTVIIDPDHLFPRLTVAWMGSNA